MCSSDLLNPFKVKNLISAAFKTVKTDETLNQSDIVTLAKQIRNLTPGKMRTMTVPLGNSNGFAPGLGSVVIWDETLAPELFDRLRNDRPVVDLITPTPTSSDAKGNKGNKGNKGKKSPTPTPSPSIIDKFKTRTASENPCGALK